MNVWLYHFHITWDCLFYFLCIKYLCNALSLPQNTVTLLISGYLVIFRNVVIRLMYCLSKQG